MSTCAVSRYMFDRSRKTVTVQDLDCVQVRVSGCKICQDLSWEQGFAKTMTSPLIIPSVLCGVAFYRLISLGTMSAFVPFCPVLSSSVQFCPVLSSFVQFCPVLSSFVSFCPVLSRSVPFCQILSSFVQFCPVLSNSVQFYSNMYIVFPVIICFIENIVRVYRAGLALKYLSDLKL